MLEEQCAPSRMALRPMLPFFDSTRAGIDVDLESVVVSRRKSSWRTVICADDGTLDRRAIDAVGRVKAPLMLLDERLGSRGTVLLIVLGTEGAFSLDRRLRELACVNVVSRSLHGVLILCVCVC
jgi:hypothetical protein